MAAVGYKGSGKIVSGDFKTVKWTGKTKSGNSVVITLDNAISMSNVDWTFAEKDDLVATVTFTATYTNTNSMVSTDSDYEEPWKVVYTAGTGAADDIVLGAGVVTIGSNDVALTRGGSHFTVEREYREINADGDRGPVKDRVVMEGSRATLELNALQVITKLTDLYPAMTAASTS